MMVVDDQGDAVGMLGQLFQGVRGMLDDNTSLRKEVESLSVGVVTHGMNILDGLGFASEAQVREVVEWECPGGMPSRCFWTPCPCGVVIPVVPWLHTGK